MVCVHGDCAVCCIWLVVGLGLRTRNRPLYNAQYLFFQSGHSPSFTRFKTIQVGALVLSRSQGLRRISSSRTIHERVLPEQKGVLDIEISAL